MLFPYIKVEFGKVLDLQGVLGGKRVILGCFEAKINCLKI